MPRKSEQANRESSRLLSLVDEYCPYCDKIHKVQKMVSKNFPVYFKGKKLLCDEIFFRCPEYIEAYGAFESSELMEQNRKAAIEAYAVSIMK